MGLDAESQDLTARIQAKRKALVAAGELDPARPGEHAIFGRVPGAADNLEAVAGRAIDMRGRRSMRPAGGDTVVEMDMTDYTGTQPGTKEALAAADADEPFAVGEEAEPEFDLGDGPQRVEDLLDDEPEEDIREAHVFPDEPAAPPEDYITIEQLNARLSGLEGALEIIAAGIDALPTRDELASALLLIAQAVERLEHPVIAAPLVQETSVADTSTGHPKKPRWWSSFSL